MTERCNFPIELLAPAKDYEGGVTAIAHGADALYVGGPAFGARAGAGNDLEAIAALTELAHRYWVRVYVAMNTILRDDELPEALALAQAYARMGVDGLIVQDMALLDLPVPAELPLIASTQTHNATPEMVRHWQAEGLTRVIVARESSLAELRAMAAAAPEIEIEHFVHGALCVSYSGRCYLSHALGGRSANRGECAQPCRKSYRLVNDDGETVAGPGHLLSLQDLDLSLELGQLLDAGVTSFKIEGRLKDRAYVATVVAQYRAALDALLAERGLRRASSGNAAPTFAPDAGRVFRRGGTTFLLRGRPKSLATIASPKSLGPIVGVVADIRGNVVQVQASEDGQTEPIHAGDGLVFFDERGELLGTRVQRAVGSRIEVQRADGLRAGVELRRNHDHDYLREVADSAPRRVIDVAMSVLRDGERFVLQARDEDGVEVEARLAFDGAAEPARDQEKARQLWEKQLLRTGDTEFRGTSILWRSQDAPLPHLPAAQLNGWRRELLAMLRSERERRRPRQQPCQRPAAPPRFPVATMGFEGNVLNDAAAAYYQSRGVTLAERAAEAGSPLRGRVVMTSRYCVLFEVGRCRRGRTPLAGGSRLIDDDGTTLAVELDCASCTMQLRLERANRPA